MTIWKIAAIGRGVVGVIVSVGPESGQINPGQLIALGAAVGFGISIAMMKSLTRTETTLLDHFLDAGNPVREPESRRPGSRAGWNLTVPLTQRIAHAVFFPLPTLIVI